MAYYNEEYSDPHERYDPSRQSNMRRGGPSSGSRGLVVSAGGGREPTIRIYVTLKKAYEGSDDYKKLIIMTSNNMYISDLKRKIEKEFVDLFPSEPPYIVAKIEDESGFSLSNNSLVGEFLKHGDRIYAQPESVSEVRSGGMDGGELRGLQGGGNAQDLLEMLKNLQTSVVAKLAKSDLHQHEDVEDLLNNVINLGFSINLQMIHNICTILSKVLTPFTVQVFDKESNRNLQDLTILLIQYWLNELCNTDTYLMTHVVLIVENLILCPALWEMLKGSPIVARLLSLSKSGSATGETKSKIIRIVTSLSKDCAPPPPPKDVPKRSRYENVNIRLYNDDAKVQDGPYMAPQPRKPDVRPRQPDFDPHSYSFDAGERRSKYSKPPSGQDSSLRNVGYSSIHDKPRTSKYRQDQPYEEIKIRNEDDGSALSSYSRKMTRNTFEKPQQSFDADYNFPLEGGARRDPTVKIPFNDNLLHDYCMMLDKENNRDINIFAIQSLEPLIKDCARNIVNDPEKFLAVFNLIEMFTMPFEIQDMQFRILDAMTEYMNEQAAKACIRGKGVSRLMKSYNYHAPNYQSNIAAFLEALCKKGLKYLDIPTVISVSLCPYSQLQSIGIRTLAIMSDNAGEGDKNLDSEFENHIPFLFEAYNTTKNMSAEARNSLLQTLANLAVRDYLRPILVDHKGLKAFLDALRNPMNVEGQRIAAKGLVNLTAGKRELRLTVISEIADEIKKLYKNELDPVVGAYIQTMIHPDNK